MRKNICIVLAMILCVSLSACAGGNDSSIDTIEVPEESTALTEEEDLAEMEVSVEDQPVQAGDVLGFYILKSITGDDSGSDKDIAERRAEGAIYTLEFCDNRMVFVVSFDGEEEIGTWDENEVHIDAGDIPYTFNGKEMIWSDGGISMIFEKTASQEIIRIRTGDEDYTEETGQPLPDKEEYTSIEETLINDDAFSVRINGYLIKENKAYLELHVEKSIDEKLSVAITDASVNDVTCPPYWGCFLDGNNSEDSVAVFDFGSAGIENEINTITMSFMVNIGDDWGSDPYYEGDAAFSPSGEIGNSATSVLTEDDMILLDEDGYTFAILALTKEDREANRIRWYIENRGEHEITVSVKTAIINGSPLEPYWMSNAKPGKKTITSMALTDDVLETTDLGDWRYLKMSVVIRDAEDAFAEALFRGDLECDLQGE